MAITYIDSGTAAVRNGTSAWPATKTLTPTLPASLTDGDLMVLFVGASGSFASGGNPGTFDTPSGWSAVDETTFSSATRASRLKVMYRRYVAGDGNPTVTCSDGTGTPATMTWWARIAAYRGVKASGDPWNVKNTAAANSATATVTTITTTVNGC